MPDRAPPATPERPKTKPAQDRLSRALRENLKKRKDQSKARATTLEPRQKE